VKRFAVLLLVGCGSNPGSDCGPSEAMVDRVIDGDTIVLTSGVKIRYLLMNAPEITNGHNDCYGHNAAQFNSDLVLGKTVQLAYDVQCEDMYGRTLAYVSVDGTEVNSLMVERGYACVLHIPPDGDARADEFEQLQAEARAANRGLWGACNPIPCN
jgi:micrococcal nuclease